MDKIHFPEYCLEVKVPLVQVRISVCPSFLRLHLCNIRGAHLLLESLSQATSHPVPYPLSPRRTHSPPSTLLKSVAMQNVCRRIPRERERERSRASLSAVSWVAAVFSQSYVTCCCVLSLSAALHGCMLTVACRALHSNYTFSHIYTENLSAVCCLHLMDNWNGN